MCKGGSMELIKNNIHMNKIMKSEAVSIFVNHEERLMESQPEITEIISHKEMVTTDSIAIRNSQVIIGGTISYNMLYSSDAAEMAQGIEGEVPFEEAVKIQGLDETQSADVRLVVVSSSIKLIDSKNYIYKIQLMAYITIEHMEDLEVLVSASQSNMMTRYDNIECLSLVANKTDTFKINEQIGVPSGKQPIGKILWKDVKIKNVTTRLMDGVIHIGGELYVFVIYAPEEENTPLQWIETTINFGGTLPMEEAKESMISYIDVNLHNISIEPEMNQDSEMRNLDINAILKLTIKVFEETETEILEDVYSPGLNLVPVTSNKTYERLLVKNESRTKNTVKLKIDKDRGHILQICNSSADINIDSVSIDNNGLKVMGKIKTRVMYISSDDSHPVCCQVKESDFQHRIDADGINGDDKYFINWRVEQVSANMLSTDEVEVKAVVALEAIVFRQEQREFIDEIKEEPVDYEAMNQAPLIKGYVVQSGDTLWKLAKQNYTTMEKIIEVNQLKSSQIKKGDRLLLVKSCQ